MKTVVALVALMLIAAGCGTSASSATPLNETQACRQWEHLKAHPGDDPMGATGDLLEKVKPASRIGRALLQLDQDMIHNATHQQTRPLDPDLLRLDRICA